MVTLKILSLEEKQAPPQRREPRADNAGISGTAGGHPTRHRNQTRVCTLIWGRAELSLCSLLNWQGDFSNWKRATLVWVVY